MRNTDAVTLAREALYAATINYLEAGGDFLSAERAIREAREEVNRRTAERLYSKREKG